MNTSTAMMPENNQMTLYEEMITKQLKIEVSNKIAEFIDNYIDTVVNELAAEAVRNWSIQMKSQKSMSNGFDNKTEIQINFVENIVRTIEVPNDIEIKVNTGS